MSRYSDSYNGIICINKPSGFTSFDVIAKMRGILRQRKIGHLGTLDPMATGVLPLLLGKATRICDIIPDTDKAYSALLRFGIVTDTQDITGTVTERYDGVIDIREQDLLSVIERFTGEIEQIPPMYSAVKKDGKRLYELARKGIEIERESRRITINSIRLTEFNQSEQTAKIDVSCSKGTYIRTLCHDIGRMIGTGAALESLVRTEAGSYTLNDCLSFDEVQTLVSEGGIESVIKPIQSAFGSLPAIKLDDTQERMFLNGVRLDTERIAQNIQENSCYTVFSQSCRFLGIAKAECGELVIVKVLCCRDELCSSVKTPAAAAAPSLRKRAGA